MKNIDVLLVNPSNRARMYGSLGTSLAGIEPPLWTGLIANVIRSQGYSVKIIDAEAEGWGPELTAESILEYAPVLIGISAIGANPSASSTPKMAAVSKVLHSLQGKLPDSKTFLYGIHPSALPEKTLTEEPVDFICRGECFYTLPQLLEYLKSSQNVQDAPIEGIWYVQDGEVVSN
jgi:radical SAM superfamily enzyme YgiQ (UPF0313 family)